MHKNIWLRYFEIDDLFTSDYTHDKDSLLNIVRNESNIMKYYHDINARKKYIEISEWCNENFEDEFCLWIDSFSCNNELDFMAFKLRWL